MPSVSATVLVLYDAHGPQIEPLALAVAEGARKVSGVSTTAKHILDTEQADIIGTDAIVLGSPNWSGITGALKSWLDDRGDLWEEGSLAGKVGAAFTTGRGRHSGLEFTLLSLIHWLLASGMIIVGLPWNERMKTSGSYYGVTAAGSVTEDDQEQARALGQRVAETALSLKLARSQGITGY